MGSMDTMSCFTLRESRDLASAVYRYAELPPEPLEERDFEGGEFKLRPLQTVRDHTALVLQCLAGTTEVSASERLVRLLFLLYGLRDAGALIGHRTFRLPGADRRGRRIGRYP